MFTRFTPFFGQIKEMGTDLFRTKKKEFLSEEKLMAESKKITKKIDTYEKPIEPDKQTKKQKRPGISSLYKTHDGNFNPIYLWSSLFLFVIWLSIFIKLGIVFYGFIMLIFFNIGDIVILAGLISDTLLLGLVGFVTALIAFYNQYKLNKMKCDNETHK